MARELTSKEIEILDVIKPLRSAKWQADYRWDRLESQVAALAADYGDLEMTPDFQRGHVWLPVQRLNFIQNCLRGIVPSSGLLVQFNSPSFNENADAADLPPGLQCVDGLQRFTAVVEFVKGNVKPFGLTAQELVGTQFCPKRIHMKVAILDFTSRADLLSYYLDVNSGGTPHSAQEIERVRQLHKQAQAGAV